MKISERIVAQQTVTREWAIDVDGLRRDFGYDLREEGLDLSDEQAVVDACWDNGVRTPYFELQDESDDSPALK